MIDGNTASEPAAGADIWRGRGIDPAAYGAAANDFETPRGSLHQEDTRIVAETQQRCWRASRCAGLRSFCWARTWPLTFSTTGIHIAALAGCSGRRAFGCQSKAWHDGPKQEIEARGEQALDRFASDLGVLILSGLEPRRIWEWRTAFANREA